MKGCIFCKIAVKKVPVDIIFEDRKCFAILDIDDSVKGHILVIWKKHCLNISDLTESEYLHFSKVFYKLEKTTLKLLKKKRSLILKTGGFVPHLHLHIYPIDINTSWDEIKLVFDQKVKYKYKKGEKEKLFLDLNKALSD